MSDQCSVADETGQCTRPAYSRGWCRSHYSRWSRDGEPGPVAFRQVRKGSEAVCSEPGCGRVHVAKGYCATHHRRDKAGKDLAQPIQQQASKVRLTDHEMGLIADISIPAREVAEQIGLHPNTINLRRREMGLGVLRVSEWTDYEIDFLIENIGRMKTERMAGFLNRDLQTVQFEINRLRANGEVQKRSLKRLDPWVISGRPLIAKTCLDCGLFLDAGWFPFKTTKTGKKRHWQSCKKCRVTRKQEAPTSHKEKWAAVNREYMAKLQAYTLERADNHGKEWTTTDLKVLEDKSKTTLEKALELRRTYAATADAISRNGLASKPFRLGDPHDSTWQLFWEIEADDLEKAS